MPQRRGHKFGYYTNKTIRYQDPQLIENICNDRIVYKDKPEIEKKEVSAEGLLNSIGDGGGLSEMLISYMSDNNIQDVKFEEGFKFASTRK